MADTSLNRRTTVRLAEAVAYAQIGIAYYVIFDPEKQLSDNLLQVFELHGKKALRFCDGRSRRVFLRAGSLGACAVGMTRSRLVAEGLRLRIKGGFRR